MKINMLGIKEQLVYNIKKHKSFSISLLVLFSTVVFIIVEKNWRCGIFILGLLLFLFGIYCFPKTLKDYDKYDKEVRMIRQWTPLTEQRYNYHEQTKDINIYFIGLGITLCIMMPFISYLYFSLIDVFLMIISLICICFLTFPKLKTKIGRHKK